MTALRQDFYLNSNDLRKTLGLTAGAMSAIFNKLDIVFSDDDKTGKVKKLPPSEVKRILESRGFRFPDRAIRKGFLVCKGGTGKTSSSYLTGIRCSSYGARVLLIDGDPQGNLTLAFNLAKYGFELTPETPVLLDVISKEVSIEEAIIQVTPTLHLLPSTTMNSNLENYIKANFYNAAVPINDAISSVVENYDFIIYDCAPALGILNAAIVCAMDEVVLPINGDAFSMSALKDTLAEISKIEKEFKHKVEKRVLFTRYDEREYVSKKYLGDAAGLYGPLMYQTVIKQCADIKTAISKNDDLFALSKKSNAREDYDEFTKEFIGLNKVELRLRAPKKKVEEELEAR
jgi:chromosome partitioning protein